MVEKKTLKIKKNTKIGLIEIVVTSILTAILTSISSYFVMSSQLKKEQKYWSDRMKMERIGELMDKQIHLLEEVNTDILLAEVMMKDIKLESAKFMSLFELLKISPTTEIDFDDNELYKKTVEYHKHLYKLGAKLQMVEIYFGEKVDSLIAPLSESLTYNYNYNFSLRDTISLNQINLSMDYFKRDFDTIKDLSKNRINIISAMKNEINEIAIRLYNPFR